MIKRLPPNQGKATPYPTGEPNFYRISEQYPLPPLSGSNHPSSSASATSSAAVASPASQSTELPRDQKPAAHESSANSEAKSFHGTSSDSSIRDSNAYTMALSAEPPYLHTNQIQLPSSSTLPSPHAYSSGLAAPAYQPFPPHDWSYQQPLYSGYPRFNPPYPDVSRNYQEIPYFQSHHQPFPSHQPQGSYVPPPPHQQGFPFAMGGHSARFVQSQESLVNCNQITSTAAHWSSTGQSGQFEQHRQDDDPFGGGNSSNQKDL